MKEHVTLILTPLPFFLQEKGKGLGDGFPISNNILKIALILIISFTAINTIAKDEVTMDSKVFYCNGAGLWFPDDPAELKNMVDGFIKDAPSIKGNPFAIISPHAGFVYSGKGAGAAYKALQDKKIRRVVILGPSHSWGFRGISVLRGFDYYKTPLGNIRIDAEGLAKLLMEKHFTYEPSAHKPEHSVENQIPFIQRALPGVEIITCVVGVLEENEMKEAGKSLSKLLDGTTVFAVSSDFTHYGRSFSYVPFEDDIRNNLEKLDNGAIKLIERTDGSGFLGYIEKTGATICGCNPIALMLFALSGKVKGELLKYYTSSDETRDFSHVVCYASIVIVQK